MEKWLFRLIVASVAAATTAAVVSSRDDIKRYVKMRQM